MGMSAAAELFRTSGKTVRKWANRYDKFGTAGLLDQHRAPHKQTRKIPSEVEQQVVKLRHEHPTLGARQLIREFGLPLRHGTVDKILKAHNLIQPPKNKFSQQEEEARMATLLEAFGSQGIPDDMEGDALSSPFEIENLVLELKRLLLANGWTEGEKLDARSRNAALCIHFCMLLEPFKTPATSHEEFKETPQEANPGLLPGFTSDDWQQLVCCPISNWH
jgi:transposase